jgi:hypothetical protein
MVVTPPYLLQALANTELLNPGLVIAGEHAYMTRPDGRKTYIRKTTEGLQLYMNAEGCRPSKQHMMLRTPHAVSKPGSLLCTICQCAGEKYSGQGQAPSKAELGFISMLASLELDQQTAWQVATWWWKERKAQIDAYIYTAKLYLQVDGSKHTSCFRGKKAASSIATDVDCCAAAWEAGASLMRVHHADIGNSESLLEAVVSAKQQQCIVLSPSFSTVNWKGPDGGRQTYAKYLLDRLPDCVMTDHGSSNIVYTRKLQQ